MKIKKDEKRNGKFFLKIWKSKKKREKSKKYKEKKDKNRKIYKDKKIKIWKNEKDENRRKD